MLTNIQRNPNTFTIPKEQTTYREVENTSETNKDRDTSRSYYQTREQENEKPSAIVDISSNNDIINNDLNDDEKYYQIYTRYGKIKAK